MSSEFLSVESDAACISGIDEPTVCQYFSTLNSGNFSQTAALFAENGTLKPPFDRAIQGEEAITAYLAREARGMTFCPEQGECLTGNEGQAQIGVKGKVDTSFFAINVSWLFELTDLGEIASVEIKLLAALNELLQINRGPSVQVQD